MKKQPDKTDKKEGKNAEKIPADKKPVIIKNFLRKKDTEEEVAPSRKQKPKAASGLRIGKSRPDKIEKRMPKPKKWYPYTPKKKKDE